jgi:hypothetical protein
LQQALEELLFERMGSVAAAAPPPSVGDGKAGGTTVAGKEATPPSPSTDPPPTAAKAQAFKDIKENVDAIKEKVPPTD